MKQNIKNKLSIFDNQSRNNNKHTEYLISESLFVSESTLIRQVICTINSYKISSFGKLFDFYKTKRSVG